jgi:hypothetical protein
MDAQPEVADRNTLSLKGAAAALRWGYQVVATLGAWTVAGAPGAWTFTATLLSTLDADDFRLSQRLEVATPNGWRWWVDANTLQIANGTLTASIRSQQES